MTLGRKTVAEAARFFPPAAAAGLSLSLSLDVELQPAAIARMKGEKQKGIFHPEHDRLSPLKDIPNPRFAFQRQDKQASVASRKGKISRKGKVFADSKVAALCRYREISGYLFRSENTRTRYQRRFHL